MPARKDYFGCPGELFWLARGIVLVSQGNSSGVELKQFRTCLTYVSSLSLFCLRFHQNANTTLSLWWPMKFGNIIQWKPYDILQRLRHCRGRLIASYGFGWWRFSEPAYCNENIFFARRGGWKLVVNKAVLAMTETRKQKRFDTPSLLSHVINSRHSARTMSAS